MALPFQVSGWWLLRIDEAAGPDAVIMSVAMAGRHRVFRRSLRRLGVKQRFGPIGKKGSIALIERLWRTLKDTLGLRLLRPLAAEDLVEKIEMGLVRAPSYDANLKRWTARAKTSGNSHCAPTAHRLG